MFLPEILQLLDKGGSEEISENDRRQTAIGKSKSNIISRDRRSCSSSRLTVLVVCIRRFCLTPRNRGRPSSSRNNESLHGNNTVIVVVFAVSACVGRRRRVESTRHYRDIAAEDAKDAHVSGKTR